MQDAIPIAPIAPVDRTMTGSAPSSVTLDRVLSAELCAGCGLCAGISDGAIAMTLTDDGFSRPVVQTEISDTLDNAIAQTCPGAVVAEWPSPQPSHVSLTQHPYWGPYIGSATGNACDADVRFNGSSGGMLSALAIHALATGQVDGVLHIAGDAEQPLRNAIRVSRTRSDVLGAAGSRYGPSPLLENIDAILSHEDDRFMVIGKPCDISALRRLALVDARVDRRIVFMLSFFCGGMPSLGGTHDILQAMGMDANDITAFRYRGEGWPGTAKAVARDGTSAVMSYADSWGSHLSGTVQYRCKICPDAVGGSADIVCADAWYGGESGYPQFDEQDGRSLVLDRTMRGRDLLQSASAANMCVITPLPVGEIDLMQPSQARRKRLVLARSLAARALFRRQPKMRGVHLLAAAQTAGMKEQLTNFLGSLRRIIMGRR